MLTLVLPKYKKHIYISYVFNTMATDDFVKREIGVENFDNDECKSA